MTDDDSQESRRRFDERLSSARQELDASPVAPPQPGDRGNPGSSSVGGRIAADFVAGIIGGALLGYVLDWWFGTSPWLLVVFLLLGFGAGVMNSYRTAKRASEANNGN
jgi:ATP synthase protein I